MRWVLDASALLVAGLPGGEQHGVTLDRMARTGTVSGPAILASDCGNVIHRKRPRDFGVTSVSRTTALELLLARVEVVPSTPAHRELAGQVAENEGLCFYDAEYVAAAALSDAVLVTQDRPLRAAAARVLGDSRALDWDAARRRVPTTAA